jgi:methenyltetrahydrofolate cyclohydrolase
MTASFLDQPLERFLDLVAAREPAPGGGAVSAVTAAAAASLTAMAARFSGAQIPAELVGQADELRHRALRLAAGDADAYPAVLAAYARPREPDPAGRTAQIRLALRGAAEIPLELAGVAAQVAALALRVARDGNPNLKDDAMTAILLAEAAARSAAGLVRANAELGQLGLDLTDRAGACVSAAARARDQAGADGPAVSSPAVSSPAVSSPAGEQAPRRHDAA